MNFKKRNRNLHDYVNADKKSTYKCRACECACRTCACRFRQCRRCECNNSHIRGQLLRHYGEGKAPRRYVKRQTRILNIPEQGACQRCPNHEFYGNLRAHYSFMHHPEWLLGIQ